MGRVVLTDYPLSWYTSHLQEGSTMLYGVLLAVVCTIGLAITAFMLFIIGAFIYSF